MKKIIFLSSAILSISAVFSQNGEIKLLKGQKFIVDNTISAVTTQSLMGQSIESNAALTSKYSIEVKDSKEDTYSLVNTFTVMKITMSAMGNNMNFNSEKKEDMNGEYGASFKDIINKPKDVVIDLSGKIINTTKEETKPGNAQEDVMKMMIEQLLGDPQETGYGVTAAFAPVSPKFIAGYSWTDSSSLDGIQKSTTYSIKEIKGNDAIITIAGTMLTDAKSQMQGMDIVNKSKGNLTGEETIDITTGVIKNKATTLESTGTMAAQGMEIPMTTKITLVTMVKPA